MRTLALAFVVSLAALFGFASSANAIATVDLVWSATTGTDPSSIPGGTVIASNPGDLNTLDIFVTAGTEGLSSIGFSISFDTSELQVVGTPGEFGVPPAAFPCTPFPTCFTGPRPDLSPLSPGVAGVDNTGGFVFTFENATLTTDFALASFGPWKIGSIVFSVQSGVNSDPNVDGISGFFNPGVDAAYNGVGAPVTMVFNSAKVDAFVPEPGTTALLGLGLLGLTLAGRRSRK